MPVTLAKAAAFYSLLPRWLTRLALGLVLTLYVLVGYGTQSKWGRLEPFESSLHDYRVYERALDDAAHGRDPYSVRRVGIAFLYPPPGLLVFEPFRLLPTLQLRGLGLALLSAALLGVILVGIARLYGFGLRRVWFWIPLSFGFAPFFTMIREGQVNMLTEFGIFLLYWAELSRPIVSGIGWGIAILTKVSPALFGFYLVLQRRWYALAAGLLFLFVISILGLVRYGPGPYLTYPDVFGNLVAAPYMGQNSQILAARISITATQARTFLQNQGLPGPAEDARALAVIVSEQRVWIQRGVTLYVFIAIGLSGWAALRLKEREPFFLVTCLGMLLSANVMWYHHYVFLLLPFFVWMAWRKLHPAVVAWCVLVLLIIQFDRWILTQGLLNQIVLHLSLLAILIPQLCTLFRSFPSIRLAPESA